MGRRFPTRRRKFLNSGVRRLSLTRCQRLSAKALAFNRPTAQASSSGCPMKPAKKPSVSFRGYETCPCADSPDESRNGFNQAFFADYCLYFLEVCLVDILPP
jgi:hypothetical protein